MFLFFDFVCILGVLFVRGVIIKRLNLCFKCYIIKSYIIYCFWFYLFCSLVRLRLNILFCNFFGYFNNWILDIIRYVNSWMLDII